MDKPEFIAIKGEPDDGTFRYINSENETPPDQPGFYLEESKEDLKALLEDERICQLCKQIFTHTFTPGKDLKRELTHNPNIPEVSFGSINEPVMCSSCLGTQIFQGTVVNNSTRGQDNISNTSENKEGASFIKIEAIEIKSADSEDENTSSCDGVLRRSRTNQNRQVASGTLPDDRGPALEDSSEKPKFKCDTCEYGSKYRYRLARHQLIHKDKSEVRTYKCHICPYETKYEYGLRIHGMRHGRGRSPGPLMYTCEKCSYETEYRCAYRQHRRTHANVSPPMYNCDKCPYKTRSTFRFVQHQQRHPSDEEVFQCGDCNYRVQDKKLFERHRIVHAVPPLVMFKCGKCNYETKTVGKLKLHQIRHRVYKCGACAYESERKEDVVRHRETHGGEAGLFSELA